MDASICTMAGSHNTQFQGRIHANGADGSASTNNAYRKCNCDLDGATVEGRDESGRTTRDLDTIARKKTRGRQGSGAATKRNSASKQETVR